MRRVTVLVSLGLLGPSVTPAVAQRADRTAVRPTAELDSAATAARSTPAPIMVRLPAMRGAVVSPFDRALQLAAGAALGVGVERENNRAPELGEYQYLGLGRDREGGSVWVAGALGVVSALGWRPAMDPGALVRGQGLVVGRGLLASTPCIEPSTLIAREAGRRESIRAGEEGTFYGALRRRWDCRSPGPSP